MINLAVARNCLRVMQENGTYENQRIGRVKTAIEGYYREGQIVLFREEVTPSDSELCMGEYAGMEQQPAGTVTVEIPLTQEGIDWHKAKGSLLTTMVTMIEVPEGYIEEIII